MAKNFVAVSIRDFGGTERKVRCMYDTISEEYTQLVIDERTNNTDYGQNATINETTETLVVAENDDRLLVQITNRSGAMLYVGFDDQVTDEDGAKPGTPLPNGATWGDMVHYGDVYVIAKTGAGSGLKVQWRESLVLPAA